MKASIRIFLCGIIVLAAFSCKKENTPEWSDFVEGYITGYYKCYEGEDSTLTPMVYCVLIQGSKNANSRHPLDFYTFNIPYELINYPENEQKLLISNECGPIFFPDSLMTRYKIRFQYQVLNENEKKRVAAICSTILIPFPWEEYSEIRLKNIAVISNDK